jgi:hypothetical protein
MGVRPRDTSPEAWAIMEAGYRRMTPRERVERSVALTVLAHSFALAEIRRQFPDEDERTNRLRLAARTIDAKTMKAAFDWPPDDRD